MSYVASSCLCVPLCVLSSWASCAVQKRLSQLRCPSGLTRVSLRNPCIKWGRDPSVKRDTFRGICRPIAKYKEYVRVDVRRQRCDLMPPLLWSRVLVIIDYSHKHTCIHVTSDVRFGSCMHNADNQINLFSLCTTLYAYTINMNCGKQTMSVT